MQNTRLRICGPERCVACRPVICQQNFFLIDLRVGDRLSANDDVRLNNIVAEDDPQFLMLVDYPPHVRQMQVLLVVSNVSS